jgi:phosphoribosylaminoimidazolecarboxamide formyltransferase/IMP cyclohydrolase
MTSKSELKIRRALFTVSDKAGIVDLARALHKTGTEIVATGKTATVLQEAGIPIVPIEKITGTPEAFQGRMKTLSFQVCSGLLYRRDDAKDEADLKKLGIQPIDCAVVNFYPFEKTLADMKASGKHSKKDLIEQVDIGGPTLVRAAAKNAPDVLILTDPVQYADVIGELDAKGTVSHELAHEAASHAWTKIHEYDRAIFEELGEAARVGLKYGENPHQKGWLEVCPNSPLDWRNLAAGTELSYNNILDLSAVYRLLSELRASYPDASSCVIVKHNNPCGVAVVPRGTAGTREQDQKLALLKAWEGDPVSAFGGVLAFTDPLAASTAEWLSERFVEVVAAPGLIAGDPTLDLLLKKRKNLRAVTIRSFEISEAPLRTTVVGGTLAQDPDQTLDDEIRPVTEKTWPEEKRALGRFGILVCRALKSNAVILVRTCVDRPEVFQLVGAGQGQPNRVEALKWLAIPRARNVLQATGGVIGDCIFVSDAFFPFRDTVDESAQAGIRWIIQPGGSIKDQESIAASNQHGVAMAFTGRRHFRH